MTRLTVLALTLFVSARAQFNPAVPSAAATSSTFGINPSLQPLDIKKPGSGSAATGQTGSQQTWPTARFTARGPNPQQTLLTGLSSSDLASQAGTQAGTRTATQSNNPLTTILQQRRGTLGGYGGQLMQNHGQGQGFGAGRMQNPGQGFGAQQNQGTLFTGGQRQNPWASFAQQQQRFLATTNPQLAQTAARQQTAATAKENTATATQDGGNPWDNVWSGNAQGQADLTAGNPAISTFSGPGWGAVTGQLGGQGGLLQQGIQALRQLPGGNQLLQKGFSALQQIQSGGDGGDLDKILAQGAQMLGLGRGNGPVTGDALKGQPTIPGAFGIDWRKVLFGSDPRLMRYVTRDGLAPEVDANSTSADSNATSAVADGTETGKAIALAMANQTGQAGLSGDSVVGISQGGIVGNQLLPNLNDAQLAQLQQLGQLAVRMRNQRNILRQRQQMQAQMQRYQQMFNQPFGGQQRGFGNPYRGFGLNGMQQRGFFTAEQQGGRDGNGGEEGKDGAVDQSRLQQLAAIGMQALRRGGLNGFGGGMNGFGSGMNGFGGGMNGFGGGINGFGGGLNRFGGPSGFNRGGFGQQNLLGRGGFGQRLGGFLGLGQEQMGQQQGMNGGGGRVLPPQQQGLQQTRPNAPPPPATAEAGSEGQIPRTN